VLEKEGSGAIQIDLHPLVVINISDHHTHVKVSRGASRVIGALLGVQEGRNIEVTNSFELTYDLIDSAIIIDYGKLRKKIDMYKKVFPTNDFLGWYSTGSSVLPSDIEVHKQFLEFNESPIYLLLDPVLAGSQTSRDLPITLFESELHIISEQPTLLFAKVPYKIQTGEAERIGVDHVAHMTPSGSSEGSQLASHLMTVHNAVKMLNVRVKILLSFLQQIKSGQGQVDHAVLRQLHALTDLLPTIETPEFRDDLFREYNDVLLVTYLAGITKSTSTVNDLVDKFNLTFERHTRRRGFI